MKWRVIVIFVCYSGHVEITYHLATFFTSVLIILGLILLIRITHKVLALSRISKTYHARKSIAKHGLLGGIIALVALVTLGVIFEPASIKAERMAKQNSSSIRKSPVESEDGTLPRGVIKIDIEGAAGERTKTYEAIHINSAETGRKLLKDEITKESIDRIVRIGTYIAPAAPSQSRNIYTLPSAP